MEGYSIATTNSGVNWIRIVLIVIGIVLVVFGILVMEGGSSVCVWVVFSG